VSAGGRRRRRGGRKAASLAGDPLDLFLDAITNALGVIMFILLMVVLFGRASDAPQSPAEQAAEATEVERLESQVRELQAKVDALPPRGDPELAARWKAAMERLPAMEQEVAALKSARRRDEQDALAAEARLANDRKTIERMTTELASVQQATRAPTGFVRISRFQQDPRKAVILAVADGRVSRIRATKETKSISAPTAGTPITDQASADAAVRSLLAEFQPSTHRVELLVWEGSFMQAKLAENAIEDLRFDSNPIPVRAGTALEPGAGGVQ
jgi:hypothetical protein